MCLRMIQPFPVQSLSPFHSIKGSSPHKTEYSLHRIHGSYIGSIHSSVDTKILHDLSSLQRRNSEGIRYFRLCRTFRIHRVQGDIIWGIDSYAIKGVLIVLTRISVAVTANSSTIFSNDDMKADEGY